MELQYPTALSRKHHIPGVKRQRILNACNQCRKRKVRCDEAQPRCRNCTERNEECITTDSRAQENVVVRRRTSKTPSQVVSGHSPAFVDEVSKSPTQPIQSSDTPRHEAWQNPMDANWSHLQKISQYSSSGSTPSYLTSRSEPSPAPNAFQNQGRYELSHRGASSVPSPASRTLQSREGNGADTRQYSYNQEMIINKTAHHKRKFIGGGTLQSLSKYLDHYFEYRGMERIGPRFVYGMQHAEEFPLPPLGSAQDLPSIPELCEREKYLEVFFDRIHPIFPVLDPALFRTALKEMVNQDPTILHQEKVPLLASAYCVFALGADESAGHCTEVGFSYLSAAYSLWTYIVSVPYLASVQALLLLTIALKARNKDGCGGQSLAQAIRIAQSLGINHAIIVETTTVHGEQLSSDEDMEVAARCWWICYCLEQNFGLEIGRPILIRDINCHQLLPRAFGNSSDFFGQWIRLCLIQSRLYEALYARPANLRNASDLLRDIGDIDRELCDWASSVEPEEIRPTLDLLCPPEELHFATFLAVNYFQTLIIVHQASLLVEPGTYKAKVELLCLDSPSRARLRSSELILVNSARKIADLLLRQVDQKAHSRILGPTGSMIALMILGCHIMKDPGERRNRADLELMTALSRYAEAQYSESGQHPKFVEAITILQQQIQEEIRRRDSDLSSSGSAEGGTQLGYSKHSSAMEVAGHVNYQDQWAHSTLGQLGERNDVFGDFVLDDPWNFLQGSDIGTGMSD